MKGVMMTNVIVELYEALLKAGVDDTLARGAAAAVMPASALDQLASKQDIADIKTLIAETRSDLIMWNVGAMAGLTGVFAAIVAFK